MRCVLFHVEKTGLATSFQDIGRYGFQRFGVVASGAMDPFSYQWANLLVGNPRQTTGGYPLLGTVISSDIPKLVQMPLDGIVHFKETSIDSAQVEYRNVYRQFRIDGLLTYPQHI